MLESFKTKQEEPLRIVFGETSPAPWKRIKDTLIEKVTLEVGHRMALVSSEEPDEFQMNAARKETGEFIESALREFSAQVDAETRNWDKDIASATGDPEIVEHMKAQRLDETLRKLLDKDLADGVFEKMNRERK